MMLWPKNSFRKRTGMSQVTIRRPFGELDLWATWFPDKIADDDNAGLGLIDGDLNSILTGQSGSFGQVENYDSNSGSFSLHPYRNFRR